MNSDSFLKNPTNLFAAGNMAGTAVSSLSKPTSASGQGIGGMLSGAGTGAAVGSMFGPMGTGIGAAAGAVGGLITGSIRAKEAREAEKFAMQEASRARNRMLSNRGKAVAAEFSNENIKSNSYVFAKGGYLKYARGGYLVEDGEVMYSNEGDPPMTNSQGKAARIAPGTYKFSGDTHRDSSGGIGVTGGSSSFMDGTGNAFRSGFVLSNRLRTDPKPFLKHL